ncbi:MAG: hypothetical protein MR842_02970 [Clostridiales bacterium]|nr:hypothetical protein [Clostridiales bacterium]MDY4009412.1 hypothetical protein [Candidatus Limiplasma sp.]
MNLLIAEPSGGVWEACGAAAPLRAVPCEVAAPCVLCAAARCAAICSASQRDCVCLRRRDWREICRMPAAPGVSCVCLSPCERYLYQLSAEADCVHTRSLATGQLLFAAPTGVFPRGMCLEPSGRHLLVAGGAVDEAYVLSAPELMLERVIHTKHPCFAASFWQEGLLLVCATEGEDIQTAVYTLPARGMRPRRLLELPGQPGGLCVCPDGRSALISSRAGLMKLEIATGELKWNLPEWPLCMRLCCQGAMALVSGTLNGQVCLLSHYKPWLRRTVFQGTEAQACFLPEDGIVSGETAHP